jgi:hypothetical protein
MDYGKLAELAGLKNASTASVMYGNARRKLLGVASKAGDGDGPDALDSATATTTTPKKKATPRKRKTATPKTGGEGAENGEGDSVDGTPTKRTRKTPAKKAAKSAPIVKENSSDAETVVEG